MRFRRDAIDKLKLANSFYCTAGKWPCRGWILLARDDYNNLDKYSTSLELNIGDTNNQNNVSAIKYLSVVQAQCVTRGLAADKNALYLVEVTDGRGLLTNKWFQFPTTSIYNIRAPAYPQTFHPQSMNSGTTWTWDSMVGNLWTQMQTFLGTYPGLPNNPEGTPEGFWLYGLPAWDALCGILDHLGFTVAMVLSPVSLSRPRYSIVASGAADPAFESLTAKYVTNLEDDLEWLDVGAARVPKTIKVLFKRRNSVYGTEETVTYRSDVMAYQWDMSPFYAVTIQSPSAFTMATGTHLIWSDYTVRYDDSNNPLDADIAAATAIAGQLVTRYFDRIYSGTDGYLSRTYGGALPFLAGSKVDGVRWSQDYSNQDRQGWKTDVVRLGGSCPWPEVYGDR